MARGKREEAATGAVEPPRPLGGLALLNWLRPPPGFVTEAALGTTYSLDLVTCTAALVSLDGGVRDSVGFGQAAALRAMTRLGESVRVLAQPGYIYAPAKTRAAIMPMLDRFVRPVRRPDGSFHPKVWVVRQRRRGAGDEDSEVRYVLVVGSRNLTRDVSWDLGVGIEGRVRGRRGVSLPGAGDFVRFACGLGGVEWLAERLADVDDVVWTLPRGVRRLRFGFHGAEAKGWRETALGTLAAPARKVLWISPFLGVSAVREVAALWHETPERRLVAGEAELDRVARSVDHALLGGLAPRAMAAASDVPPRQDVADEVEVAGAADDDAEPEAQESIRGLHAKAVAVWRGKRKASVLLGSANLSRRGWLGANVEAWMLLEGDTALADGLWAWSAVMAREEQDRGRSPKIQFRWLKRSIAF